MLTHARGRSALAVGLLTIAGAIVFVVLFFYSTNRALGGSSSTVFVKLDAATGLQPGDAVLHLGVKVGQVKTVDFAAGDVIVRLRLTREVPVSSSAHASMMAADIFGRQSIVITEGERRGAPLSDGDTLSGTGPVSMSDRLGQLGAQASELLSDHTIAEVRKTLHGAGSAAHSAATAATRIGSLANGAEELIGEQRQLLGDLTREAGLLARNLRVAADPDDLAGLLSRLDTSATSLVSASASMDSAAAALDRILDGLEAGRGTAGRLLVDPELYDRATASLAALERLLADLRENPKRYVTFKVF